MKLRSPLTLVGIRGPMATIVDCVADDGRARGRLEVPEHARPEHERLVRATAFIEWLEANPSKDLTPRDSEARYQRELGRLRLTDDDVDMVRNPWFIRAPDGAEIEVAEVMFREGGVFEWVWP